MSDTRYRDETDAKLDRLCVPIPVAEIVQHIRRSQRTIDRWIKDGHLRVIHLQNPPENVVIKRDLVDLEKRMRDASRASRDRIAEIGRAKRAQKENPTP
jgi:hypothetical protein